VRVEVFASLAHYRAHIAPIWWALPEAMRGPIHPLGDMEPTYPDSVGLVASAVDCHLLRGKCKVIYVEHGAGQTYTGGDLAAAQNPSYSAHGGERWPHVIGFIAPSLQVARNWKSAPAVAVGCPKMDQYIGWRCQQRSVCFVWHWDANFCPEASQTWTYWAAGMKEVTDHFKRQEVIVYGHGHPKWGGALDMPMRMAGMSVLPSEVGVFLHASTMFVDNSSLGPEFASLGRPVYWLNAPWYRRDVCHGRRFWEWTALTAAFDSPAELLDIDIDLLNSSYDSRRLAENAYAYFDGEAAQRAALFVMQRLANL